MKLAHGNLKEIIPKSWIRQKNGTKTIDVRFMELDNNTFGFATVDDYQNTASTLVIDPTPIREWGTYFGGFGGEASTKATIDLSGNTIFVGSTRSDNMATAGSHQTVLGMAETGLMTKFDQDGNLLWTTYYGGGLTTRFQDVENDIDNNIIGCWIYIFKDNDRYIEFASRSIQ